MTNQNSEPQYTVSKWTERDEAKTQHDNYECVKCQFSTLYLPLMEEHLAKASGPNGHGHAWAYPNSNPEPEQGGPSKLEY